MHLHNLSVRFKGKLDPKDVIEAFRNTERIRVVHADDKINSTAAIMEYARDLGHRRSDMMDLCVWEEGMGVHNDELFFSQAVHQESIVVPENIDAIRAAMGFEDKVKSMTMTDKALDLKHVK